MQLLLRNSKCDPRLAQCIPLRWPQIFKHRHRSQAGIFLYLHYITSNETIQCRQYNYHGILSCLAFGFMLKLLL